MNKQINILLVDDEEPIRDAMLLLLKAAGYRITACASGQEALQILANEQFDIVITDLFLPDITGIDILTKAKGLFPSLEVILITGHASAETAVRAMKEGAFDYITKPLNFEELRMILAKAVEKKRLLSENVYLKKQLRDKYEFSSIIGSSLAMQKVFARISKVIKTDSTILILGESGTGKDLIAKAIHSNGPRRDKPFIAVHCGAIPENLLESELFGHTKGAFTGAIRDKIGKFEAANHGTIFLDEIATLPMHLQIKLLRVLQEQEVERIGSNRQIKLDVRIISATNVDLDEEVKKGTFRDDLFYRLNVIPVTLPPLRERVEDILPLVRHFLAKYCNEMDRPVMNITKEVLMALEIYKWPGNVRELENVVERAVTLCDTDTLHSHDLSIPLFSSVKEKGMHASLEHMEKEHILKVLRETSGNQSKASQLLGIDRKTLYLKLKKYGVAEFPEK